MKEWLRVTHSVPDKTTVTVTLQDESLSVKWSVKTYVSKIGEGICEARAHAERAMIELRKVAS